MQFMFIETSCTSCVSGHKHDLILLYTLVNLEQIRQKNVYRFKMLASLSNSRIKKRMMKKQRKWNSLQSYHLLSTWEKTFPFLSR